MILIYTSIYRAVGILVSFPEFIGSADRKAEFKTIAQTSIHAFAPVLASSAGFTGSSDVRTTAMSSIQKVSDIVNECHQENLYLELQISLLT